MLGEIEVRYDGEQATHHIIAASQLAESLQGFSRIFGVSYHFALTGEFAKKTPYQHVEVYVREAEAKCYNIVFEVWESLRQHQVFSGFAGNIASIIAAYIVGRAANRKSEMKYLAQALELALQQNGQRDQQTIDRLLNTVERMADSLRPAVRQAVAPIGKSCATLRIGGEDGITLGLEDRKIIDNEGPIEFTHEKTWDLIITGLDRENFTGKGRLDGDLDARYPLVITDPTFKVRENPYISAFVSSTKLSVQGKAELLDGEIKRIYISNITK
ncbi:hypothetical protein ACFWQD_06435 [Alcaligenes faecalis]|uniref:DUF7946 domain-containing protein n=1 Tax=Alcaligenes faecalis TaxID=511 RepID=UPI0036472F16